MIPDLRNSPVQHSIPFFSKHQTEFCFDTRNSHYSLASMILVYSSFSFKIIPSSVLKIIKPVIYLWHECKTFMRIFAPQLFNHESVSTGISLERNSLKYSSLHYQLRSCYVI